MRLTQQERTQLRKLIDRATRAHAAAHTATALLNHWCEGVYGCAPADIDCDEILDGVLGASGIPDGMEPEEFDAAMRDALAAAGRAALAGQGERDG